MSNLAEYPCAEDRKCALCPTLLNHFNLGVLCNQCRRRVTEAKYSVYDANGDNVREDIRWYDVLLKCTRGRNRRYVQIAAMNARLIESTVSTGRGGRRHYPQDGHR